MAVGIVCEEVQVPDLIQEQVVQGMDENSTLYFSWVFCTELAPISIGSSLCMIVKFIISNSIVVYNQVACCMFSISTSS